MIHFGSVGPRWVSWRNLICLIGTPTLCIVHANSSSEVGQGVVGFCGALSRQKSMSCGVCAGVRNSVGWRFYHRVSVSGLSSRTVAIRPRCSRRAARRRSVFLFGFRLRRRLRRPDEPVGWSAGPFGCSDASIVVVSGCCSWSAGCACDSAVGVMIAPAPDPRSGVSAEVAVGSVSGGCGATGVEPAESIDASCGVHIRSKGVESRLASCVIEAGDPRKFSGENSVRNRNNFEVGNQLPHLRLRLLFVLRRRLRWVLFCCWARPRGRFGHLIPKARTTARHDIADILATLESNVHKLSELCVTVESLRHKAGPHDFDRSTYSEAL